ncbi:MAG: PA2817 family protein [Halioglobus sp.]
MNDEQYLDHCRQQFSGYAKELSLRTEGLAEDDTLRELALAFNKLAGGETDLYTQGQTLVARLFTTYPDFAPTFPRELLWFLGGDCLHFMADEEIDLYQQLEELREQSASKGQIIDFAAARAKLLKLQ